MKKFFILPVCLVLLLTSQAVFAQLPKDKPVQVPTTAVPSVNIGSLLTQLSGAIKPSSFLDSWASGKSGWIGKAAKVATAPETAKCISALAGFIKPDMFKKGFNVQSLINTAGTAKTIGDASGLLKNLEGGLKPEALTSGWSSSRPAWMSALNLLK
jgi:hypothetical protein